jgi:hypothetical protein
MTASRLIAPGLGLIGLLVILGTLGYPSGEYGVPGPALFPRAIGIGLLLVAAGLATAPLATIEPLTPGRRQAIVWTMALLALYAASWDLVPFVVRTTVLVLVFLRLLAVSWKAAAITAVSLSVVVFVVFDRLLAVRL